MVLCLTFFVKQFLRWKNAIPRRIFECCGSLWIIDLAKNMLETNRKCVRHFHCDQSMHHCMSRSEQIWSMWKVSLCLSFLAESILATNCALCWSNTKGWPGDCHDYAEKLHQTVVFDCTHRCRGCYCGNGLYVQKIVLQFSFPGVQFLMQKNKNSWKGINVPGVVWKLGLSFTWVMWNIYTASSKKTFFELWHK